MGERYLGRIQTTAPTSANNGNTAGTQFTILAGSKVTLVASVAGRVCVDSETCAATPGANFGIPVAAGAIFPTSVGSARINRDGGSSAVISWLPDSGAGNLDVWNRNGEE